MSAETTSKVPETTPEPNEYQKLAQERLATFQAPKVSSETELPPMSREDRQENAKMTIDALSVRPEEREDIQKIVESKKAIPEHELKRIENKRDATIKNAKRNPVESETARKTDLAMDTFNDEKKVLDQEATKAAYEPSLDAVNKYLAEIRKGQEATSVTDIEQAWIEAHASKFMMDRANAIRFESQTDGEKQKLVLKENLSASDTVKAEAFKAEGQKLGDAAGAEYTAEKVKRQEANDKAFISRIALISKVVSQEQGQLSGIRAENAEDTTKLVSDLLTNLDVDLSAMPMKAEQHGNKIRNNRTIDIFRESSDPAQKGMVYVEQVDAASGKVIRLDVLKTPKPDKESKLRMARWERKIDNQLKSVREGSQHTSLEKRSKDFGADSDGAYAGVLKNRGVGSEHFSGPEGKKKLNKNSKPWWTKLFGA